MSTRDRAGRRTGGAGKPTVVGESADGPPIEGRFQLALRGAPIFLFTQDAELRYTWAHDPLGRSQAATVIGKTDLDLNDVNAAKSAEQIMQFKREALASGSAARQEFLVSRSGQRRVVELSVEPIRDENGRVIGLS